MLVEILMNGFIRTKEWAEENGYAYRVLTPEEVTAYLKNFTRG